MTRAEEKILNPTMVERSLLVASCFLVANRALAWNFSFTDVISCQDLPVTLDVSWICNEYSTCTFGNEDASVAGEGELTILL